MNYYITPEEYDTAKSNGISRNTLDKRVRELLWDKEKAVNTPPIKLSKGLAVFKKTARKNGISDNTFYTRIQRGWSPKKASSTFTIDAGKEFLDKQRKKAIQKSRKYPNWVYESLEKHNIDRNTFFQRLHVSKWSLEKACTTPKMERGKYDRSDHVFRKMDELTFLKGAK